MSALNFTKMAATGNDFVLLDNIDKSAACRINDFPKLAKKICTRGFSVGADGMLILEGSERADVTMRIFNPDGSEVAMCGNGARCTAYYMADKAAAGKKDISIETKAGILRADVNGASVRIEMAGMKKLRTRFPLKLFDGNYEVSFVDTGVPHVIHFADDLENFDVDRIGRAIRLHSEFAPEGTNANFAKVLDKENIWVRTYERGVEGETFACGTGAVASSLIASLLYSVESPVRVKTSGGESLTIYFKKQGEEYTDVFLEGEVRTVYNGKLNI